MLRGEALTDTPSYDGLLDAKRLLRTIRAGTLATLQAGGAPFASLVSVATLVDGRPIILVSELSAHTQHLRADGRCSLLLAQAGKGDPLAHPRLTLTGLADQLEGEERGMARARFLSRQPKASLYIDFPDFSFWRMTLEAAHLNGGFARAARYAGDDLMAGSDALVEIERGAIDHMNADHRDALALYGEVLAGAGPGDWVASGLDPEGLDLICGDRVARVLFDRPIGSAGELRGMLKSLADKARTQTGEAG